MALLDDSMLPDQPPGLEIHRRVGRRRIVCAIHDIDGTHSLIRQWPPVMAAVLDWAVAGGLEHLDDPDALPELVQRTQKEPSEQALRFCEESAGMSALTQMEWAIRRAADQDSLPDAFDIDWTGPQRETNRDILRRIWAGQERFDDLPDSPSMRAAVETLAPKLFRLYEQVLYSASRDRNLRNARENPDRWRVPGSMDFLHRLRDAGCVNYFVTGSVVAASGGMAEEIAALGYDIGQGQLVEEVVGSSWDRKEPKDEVMTDLLRRLNIPGREVLVVGDGRSEIAAGSAMGAVTLSRLDVNATRQRELHIELDTNYITADFTPPALAEMIQSSRD